MGLYKSNDNGDNSVLLLLFLSVDIAYGLRVVCAGDWTICVHPLRLV